QCMTRSSTKELFTPSKDLEREFQSSRKHFKTLKMHEVVLFYNGLDVPTRQILDSRGAIPSNTTADAKVAIQEMAEYS
ncbi:hypothetical protein Tco_1542274, partial [Tanacetum coccineum]